MEVIKSDVKNQRLKSFLKLDILEQDQMRNESQNSLESKIWLDKSHPNFSRWKRGRELAEQRGELVLRIIKRYSSCENLKVLDLGSGLGGTSKIFSDKNFVVSYDLDRFRLAKQKEIKTDYSLVNGDALSLPFKKNTFDIMILQDVIEHLPTINELPKILFDILKEDGIIFISTPNKLSFINIIADPHWGLPIVSLLSRKNIKKYFLKYFRNQELNRNDIAQLFSLQDIQNHFGINFKLKLNTKLVTHNLLAGHKGIIWSSFHLRLLKLVLFTKLDKLIVNLCNDNFDFLNKYITPTFYLILTKKV